MIDEGHIEEQAAARVLGVLSPEEEAQVDRHADVCPPCKALLREAQETASFLALTVHPVRPPSQCKELLMAMIEREPSLKTVRRTARMLRLPALRLGRYHVPVWVTRGVTATALVGLLGWNTMLQQDLSEARMMQNVVATDHQPTDLKPQQGVEQKVFARMFEGPNGNAVLVCENLPELPDGKVYQVWIANEDHQRPMHTFQVAHSLEQVLMQAGEPLSDYKWVMITIEDEGGSPQPSKTTVLLGDL
jgi:anti-sigma-K factor RskA